jgi:hypothetical protein
MTITPEPRPARQVAFMLTLASGIALGACNATDDAPNDTSGDPANTVDGSTIGSGPEAGRGGTGTSAGSGGVDGRGTAAQGGSPARDAGSVGGAGSGDEDAGSTGSAGTNGGQGGSSGAGGSGGNDACAPCLEPSLSWGDIGGFVASNDRSTLSPCSAYRHARDMLGVGGMVLRECERMLPCMGSGLHGISDVTRALQHPDVQAALGAGKVLFGVDSRALDGQIFEIEQGGRVINVGSPCAGGAAACTPIPLGVNALVQLLRDIDEEQLNLTPCADMFD